MPSCLMTDSIVIAQYYLVLLLHKIRNRHVYVYNVDLVIKNCITKKKSESVFLQLVAQNDISRQLKLDFNIAINMYFLKENACDLR